MMRTGKSHAGRVNLTKYVKLRGAAAEKWRFCPVVHTSNGRIRPDYVLIDGSPELHKEGAYYIEWYRDGKRYRESVGKNPSEAFASAERKALVLKNQALGIAIVGETKQLGVTLAEACREFLEETRQHHRPKTYSQYKTALEYFLQSCREKLLTRVERTDVMSFHGLLVRQGPCPPHDLDQGAGCRLDAQDERSYEINPQARLATLYGNGTRGLHQ
jgi:hypothetical protein